MMKFGVFISQTAGTHLGMLSPIDSELRHFLLGSIFDQRPQQLFSSEQGHVLLESIYHSNYKVVVDQDILRRMQAMAPLLQISMAALEAQR
jgi:hypothetical protein